MNLIPGEFNPQVYNKIIRKRLFTSKQKEMDSTKKQRKIRRDKAKQNDDRNEPKDGKTGEKMLVPFELLHNVILCF